MRTACDNFWLGGPYEPGLPLWGEQEADVAFVNGGYPGLAAAYFIKRRFPARRVLVLEAVYIGFGSSGRNSGGVSGVLGHNHRNLKRRYGMEATRRLQRIARQSFLLVEELIREHNIACDYERTGRLVVAETNQQVKRLETEREVCEESGASVEWFDRNEARDRFGWVEVLAALRYPEEGILDPVKFLRGIKCAAESVGVEIYEHSRCTRIELGPVIRLFTPGCSIRTRDIVLATNAYPEPLRFFRHKVLPFYVYNIATGPLTQPQVDALHLPGRENTFGATNLYWAARFTSDNRLIFMKCNALYFHDVERDCSHLPSECHSHYRLLVEKFPFLGGIRMTHAWGGRIGITLDFLPTVGRTGKHGNVYDSAGCNGGGLAPAQLAAKMIAARMAEEKSELTENLLVVRRLLGIPSACLIYVGCQSIQGRVPAKRSDPRRTAPVEEKGRAQSILSDTIRREDNMINAMQHVGQGVRNVDKRYDFYKRFLGFKVKLNDITTASKEMASVVGSVGTMRMMMAVNPKGGGIIELIEHKSRPNAPFPQEGGHGNYGVLEVGYGTRNIDQVVMDFEAKSIPFLTPVYDLALRDGRRWRYAYLKDPDGLLLQLTEDLPPGAVPPRKAEVYGATHVGIGVSNIECSTEFYMSTLGFDRILHEFEGTAPKLEAVAGRRLDLKIAILERSAPPSGPLGRLLPRGVVKLIEAKGAKGKHVFEGRCWGDPGYIEVCLDVGDLLATVEAIKKKGVDIYLPPVEINMGSGSKGLVAYIRDPDGATVEFVEIKSVAWLSAASFARVALPLLRLYDRLS